MKKFFLIAALAAVMAVASSGMSRPVPQIKAGAQTPGLVVEDSRHGLDLSELRGSYVLLSFWSSSDAPSRVAVNEYDAALRSRSSESCPIRHIAVNFDESEHLFEAIVKADGLDSDAQYNASGAFAKSIIANFNLRDGFGSILIGPQGEIIAVNPEISNLTAI